MHHDPFQLIFNCDICGRYEKKIRGCKRRVRAPVISADCTCGGRDACDVCHGEGKFEIHDCPVRFVNDVSINRFLPYFWHWKATNYMNYPDSQGRYYQPAKLLEAFSVCNYVNNKREAIEAEKARNKK